MKYVIFLVGAAIALATSANAQDDRKRSFCVDYANEARDMQRRNLELGCGIQGARWGARWHEWWDGHYGRCKDWVGPEQVREHTELRRAEMASCEARNGGRRDRQSQREGRY